MRSNADAERELWKLVEKMLRRYPEEEMEVVEGWFPDPMGISLKRVAAECPPHFTARYEEQDGARRIFIRKRFALPLVHDHFHEEPQVWNFSEEEQKRFVEHGTWVLGEKFLRGVAGEPKTQEETHE